MFDPGFWELFVIGVLGLLILGPERLPVVVKKVGYWVGKGRHYLASVRSDIEREFRTDELEKMLSQQSSEIEELKNLISDTTKQATDAVEETKHLLEDSMAAEAKGDPSSAPGQSQAKAITDDSEDRAAGKS